MKPSRNTAFQSARVSGRAPWRVEYQAITSSIGSAMIMRSASAVIASAP